MSESKFRPCRKKPIIVHARPAETGEQVQAVEGLLTASEGDYVMKGVEGEIYICAKAIFEKTYDWVD